MANAYSPDYTSLVAEVQSICEDTNAEFVANIPLFIARAQDAVQRDLGLDLWRGYSDNPVTTAAIVRSTDWLIVRSLRITASNTWLEKRHLDYVRMYGGSTGRPKVWAEDEEATLMVAPTPDTSYTIRVEYYQRLPVLSTLNPTNWITRNAGDLLLLMTLVNCQLYLVSPERVAEFTGLYQMILQSSVTELRDSERQRYSPVRNAPRPVLQPGASA